MANGTVTVRRTILHTYTSQGLVTRWPKTRKPRVLALDPFGLQILRARLLYCESESARAGVTLRWPDGYVWADVPDGSEPLTPNTVTQYVRRLSRALGEPLSPHALRHFAATHLIGEGVDVRTVAAQLGHADATTTLRVYAHALDERQREAAGLLGKALGPGKI